MYIAIFIGILIFMFLVVIHELGHFWTARKFGVKVQEFGLGIPPKVMKVATDKKGTEYTLNRIPLGGFVRLKGEDPTDESEFLAPDSFISASLIGKLIILFGGIIANIIFAWIAFSISFMNGVHPMSIIPDSASKAVSKSYLMPSMSYLEQKGYITKEQQNNTHPVIKNILSGSRAETLGLMIGDQFISINSVKIKDNTFSQLLQECFGKTCTLEYIRNKETKNALLECGRDECFLGVGMGNPIELPFIKLGVGQALIAGRQEIGAQTSMSFKALGKVGAGLFSFNKARVTESTKSLSGPVGIIKMVQMLLANGELIQLLAFAGMISLALAIFNILPIPALDGGRALSVLIQAIGGRKPTTYFTIEGRLNLFFFVLLMGLGIVIIIKDLHTAWGVNIPFIG